MCILLLRLHRTRYSTRLDTRCDPRYQHTKSIEHAVGSGREAVTFSISDSARPSRVSEPVPVATKNHFPTTRARYLFMCHMNVTAIATPKTATARTRNEIVSEGPGSSNSRSLALFLSRDVFVLTPAIVRAARIFALADTDVSDGVLARIQLGLASLDFTSKTHGLRLQTIDNILRWFEAVAIVTGMFSRSIWVPCSWSRTETRSVLKKKILRTVVATGYPNEASLGRFDQSPSNSVWYP